MAEYRTSTPVRAAKPPSVISPDLSRLEAASALLDAALRAAGDPGGDALARLKARRDETWQACRVSLRAAEVPAPPAMPGPGMPALWRAVRRLRHRDSDRAARLGHAGRLLAGAEAACALAALRATCAPPEAAAGGLPRPARSRAGPLRPFRTHRQEDFRVTHVFYPFPVDGASCAVHPGPLHGHWRAAAERNGYALLGRAVDRYHVVLGCRRCGRPTLKRISVVTGFVPECDHCIRDRRAAAAERLGALLLGPDPGGHRHYGEYRLACGHVVRRQHFRVEAAAAGGHALGCERCLEDRHAAEAEARGWRLVGAARRCRRGYRRYEHGCGHRQDVAVANMSCGDVDCAGCGESWTSKPSRLYLFRILLPAGPVLKLGHSSDPAVRLRQVLRRPEATSARLLREIPVATGHLAVCIEKELHARLRQTRPDLVVARADFETHLTTVTEIYRAEALDVLSGLLDAVEAGQDARGRT